MAFTDDPNYDLRYSQLDDAQFLKTWLLNPEVGKWFPQTEEKDLDLFIKNWVGFSRFKASLTAIYKGTPIAVGTLFLMPYRKVAHMAMLNFVVAPEYQSKGVGRSLIKNLRHLAKTRFRLETLFVELYGGCKAIDFLKKVGFNEVASQADFARMDGTSHARHILEVSV